MRKKKEIINRIKVLKGRMTLMTRYRAHFIGVLGINGYFEYIDESLDELKQLNIELKKIKENEN